MLRQIERYMRQLGIGKILFLLLGCIFIALSGKAEGLSYEQYILSAATDNYYINYFLCPFLLICLYPYASDDGAIVMLRFRSYKRYFCKKWCALTIVACVVIIVQTIGVLISGVGMPMNNSFTIPEILVSEYGDGFIAFSNLFSTPMIAFVMSTIYELMGICFLMGIYMWLSHCFGTKIMLAASLGYYVYSIIGFKLIGLKTMIPYMSHMVVLQNNLHEVSQLICTVIWGAILLSIISISLFCLQKGDVKE